MNAWNLTVRMTNEPGRLAELGDTLGTAGINLAGVSGTTSAGEGTIHLLVEGDPDKAAGVLDEAGIGTEDSREVLVVDVVDEPGTLGSYSSKLADAGVNIDLVYLATGTRIVFGVDDLDAARSALSG